MNKYDLDKMIMAMEVAAYMIETDKSLEQAYEDKIVPKELRLTKEEIKNILEDASILIKNWG